MDSPQDASAYPDFVGSPRAANPPGTKLIGGEGRGGAGLHFGPVGLVGPAELLGPAGYLLGGTEYEAVVANLLPSYRHSSNLGFSVGSSWIVTNFEADGYLAEHSVHMLTRFEPPQQVTSAILAIADGVWFTTPEQFVAGVGDIVSWGTDERCIIVETSGFTNFRVSRGRFGTTEGDDATVDDTLTIHSVVPGVPRAIWKRLG